MVVLAIYAVKIAKNNHICKDLYIRKIPTHYIWVGISVIFAPPVGLVNKL